MWDQDRTRERQYRDSVVNIGEKKQCELEQFRLARHRLVEQQRRTSRLDFESKSASVFYAAAEGLADAGAHAEDDDELRHMYTGAKRRCVDHLTAVNKEIYGDRTVTTIETDGSIVIAHDGHY